MAYVRDDLIAARRILEDLLDLDPDNAEALEFRDRIERETVELQRIEEVKISWLSRLQPGVLELFGMILGAAALIWLGIYLAIGPLELASELGLSARVTHPSGNSHATSPVHFLFFGPVLLIGAGAYLGVVIFIYVRDNRNRP